MSTTFNVPGTPQWQVGDWAEQIVAWWAKKQGYAVLHISLSGAGNKITLPTGQTIPAADLVLFTDKGLEAVEVKWKECPVLYQRTKEFRHGVDLPKWDAYLHVQQSFNVPVSIWIVEYKPGAQALPKPVLLRASVDDLLPHIQRVPVSHKGASKGMVYWNARGLMDETPLQIAAYAPLHLPRLVHPWERTSRDGHAPHAGDGITENKGGKKGGNGPTQPPLF